MTNRNDGKLVIENADIRWKNFTGRESKFNPAGKRTFALFLDPEDLDLIDDLVADGWNVRKREFEDTDRPIEYYITIEVNFDYYQPPIVKMIQGHHGLVLDENTVGRLDSTLITKADVVIRPRHWEVNGKTGVKAYLHTLRAVVEEDYFADQDEDIIFD